MEIESFSAVRWQCGLNGRAAAGGPRALRVAAEGAGFPFNGGPPTCMGAGPGDAWAMGGSYRRRLRGCCTAQGGFRHRGGRRRARAFAGPTPPAAAGPGVTHGGPQSRGWVASAGGRRAYAHGRHRCRGQVRAPRRARPAQARAGARGGRAAGLVSTVGSAWGRAVHGGWQPVEQRTPGECTERPAHSAPDARRARRTARPTHGAPGAPGARRPARLTALSELGALSAPCPRRACRCGACRRAAG
jgi:hypothetical protein